MDRVVATIDECKAASAVLGFNYRGNTNLLSRPAGCYFERRDGQGSYLNSVVDPSNTDPQYFGYTGGICFKGKFWHCHGKKIFPFNT